jgi:hypothetical protein
MMSKSIIMGMYAMFSGMFKDFGKPVYDNRVKKIEKVCRKCGKSFVIKSGPSGYLNCRECNS